MSPVLRVRDLRVVRRSRSQHFELLVGRLDLMAGEVLAVLGPNGVGKSTLLRALAGLEPPADGVIERAAEGPVTMVFQRPIALSGSVCHNVRIALRARGLVGDALEQRGREALEHFGISALAERRASSLSGGELRRLALARAFALQPAVLLLDEPFDDLDAQAQEALSRDLRRAVTRTGVAVVLVTHDLRRAILACDRIAVLQAGSLRQVDARQRVLERPVDPDVARLVGMTNLLPALVSAGGFVEAGPEQRIPLPADPAIPLPAAGASVWLGLRPEHVKVDVGRGEGTPIGKAEVTEITNDGVLCVLEVRWGRHLLRTHLVAGRGLARTLRPGEQVALSVRPEDVHLLPRDAATEVGDPDAA